MIQDDTKRFWSKVAKKESGCWEWIAGKRNGYGRFYRNSVPNYLAHRFSWEIHNGPIPDGMLVCHRCDNRACVNPDHLFLGTDLDNARDKIAKGRGTIPPRHSGESHYKHKLTQDQVDLIRSGFFDGMPTWAVSVQLGVCPTTINRAKSGRTWK